MITPDEMRALQDKVPLGSRMVRYMDQVFFDAQGNWWT